MEQDEGWDQVHIIVSFKSKVIKQLCCRRARRLEVPCLIKLSMMASFHQTQIKIDVSIIVVQRCITNENSAEIMVVQLAVVVSSAFNTHPRPKRFETGQNRLVSIDAFKRCALSRHGDQRVL
jgi:hypothetical protein